MMPDRQNAFDDTVNYNVLDIDGTIEPPNPLLYVQIICSTIDLCNKQKHS